MPAGATVRGPAVGGVSGTPGPARLPALLPALPEDPPPGPRGSSSYTPAAVGGVIDYRMARRAVVRQVTRGDVPVEDVCDAHPELLRAARNIGSPVHRACPICRLADARARVPVAGPGDGPGELRLVTYVFGDDLQRRSGHVVWTDAELADLSRSCRSFRTYVVECCLVCGWNHLVESALLGQAHAVG